MKVWLDDVRPAPVGWTVCRTSTQAIELLTSGKVKEISLDHDLGDDPCSGYDVAKWIEKAVYKKKLSCPIIYTHSQNPVGRRNIKMVIDKLRLMGEWNY